MGWVRGLGLCHFVLAGLSRRSVVGNITKALGVECAHIPDSNFSGCGGFEHETPSDDYFTFLCRATQLLLENGLPVQTKDKHAIFLVLNR